MATTIQAPTPKRVTIEVELPGDIYSELTQEAAETGQNTNKLIAEALIQRRQTPQTVKQSPQAKSESQKKERDAECEMDSMTPRDKAILLFIFVGVPLILLGTIVGIGF